jgi:hypothetical protein
MTSGRSLARVAVLVCTSRILEGFSGRIFSPARQPILL